MEKLINTVIAILLISSMAFAQAPNAFKYQAVARDNSGIILANQSVSFKISVLEGSTTGTSVYSETHSTTTNDFGLVNLEIGTGTIVVGDFTSIDWGSDKHFIKIEMDEAGGTNYQEMGTTQLLSVPYALHAENVTNDKVDDADADSTNELQVLSLSNDTLYLSQGGYVIMPPNNIIDADTDSTNELQSISFSNDTLYLSNDGFVILPYEIFPLTSDNPSFTCGSTFIDWRDGKRYSTVQIGTQCWMAENLNVGKKIIYISPSNNQTNNGQIEKYCYNNDENNCDEYGGMYQWDEMMDYNPSDNGTMGTTQGICPTGWHLPTDEEWKTMEKYLGMSQREADSIGLRGTDEGGKMKETGTTHWKSPNTGATNSSGFTALPAGYLSYQLKFSSLGSGATFWSATEYNSSSAWSRYLMYSFSEVGRFHYPKLNGQSVRCIKD